MTLAEFIITNLIVSCEILVKFVPRYK